MGIGKVSSSITVQHKITFDGSCPRCGDTIFTYYVRVSDHGDSRRLMVAWCQDCQEVKAYGVIDPMLDKLLKVEEVKNNG